MTYWLVNACFLGAVAVVGILVSLMPWRPKWVAALGALGIVGVLTAIFDNAIIGFGIVDYDPSKISGVRIGVAPIEDFAYTLAGCVLIPAVWVLVNRLGDRRQR